jgi:hypothetical protein
MENENILKKDRKSIEKVENITSENSQDENKEAKMLPIDNKSNIEMDDNVEKLSIPNFKKLLGCG